MRADVSIGVFARAPRPGLTKTRLIPAVGAEGAAELSAAFLRDTIGTVEASGVPWVLFAASEEDRVLLAAEYPAYRVEVQPEGTLGERLWHAMEILLASAEAGLILGSDSPTLPLAHVRAGLDALRAKIDVVLGPAADGGYTAIGVRSPLELSAVRWSSRHTLRDTLRAAEGRSIRLLPVFYDVDDEIDLLRLAAHLAAKPSLAPNTRAVLERRLRTASARPDFDPESQPE